MIIKFNDKKNKRKKATPTTIPTDKPSDLDCINREPILHNSTSSQQDADEDSFSKGYN